MRSLALDRSAHSNCGIECPKQSRVAERLEQALHGTPFERALAFCAASCANRANVS
jgi:hypothetical protein